jgi:outer membrane protein assembly factor BamB
LIIGVAVVILAVASEIQSQRYGPGEWGQIELSGGVLDLAISSNTLFATTDHGTVVAFDATSGKRLWRAAILGKAPTTIVGASRTSLVLSSDGDTDAFDPNSGKLLWRLPGRTSDCITIDQDSSTVYIAGSALMAIDGFAGQVKWRRSTGGGRASCLLALRDNLVVCGVTNNGTSRLGAYRISNGSPLWHVSIHAIAIHADGPDRFVVLDESGALCEISAVSGHVLWRQSLPGQLPANCFALSAAKDGTVIASAINRLYCFKGSTGEKLWTRKFSDNIGTEVSYSADYACLGLGIGKIVVIDMNTGADVYKCNISSIWNNISPTNRLVGTCAKSVVLTDDHHFLAGTSFGLLTRRTIE